MIFALCLSPVTDRSGEAVPVADRILVWEGDQSAPI